MWKRRPNLLSAAIVLWLSALNCAPSSPVARSLEAPGKSVLLEDGVSFWVPADYHEMPNTQGRSFRMRGSAKASYDTIVVQRREPGAPMLLDQALSDILSRLEALEQFDLLDVQLHYVGPYLSITYAADFGLLDVARRQWGVLIGTDTGILAIFMTSPKDTFFEASDDYLSLLHSLSVVSPAPATVEGPAP